MITEARECVGTEPMQVVSGAGALAGELSWTPSARGLVLFAHGSRSGRRSPRHQHVARTLQERRFATVLIDLLTPDEQAIDAMTGDYRFNIPWLARRLGRVIDWMDTDARLRRLPVGIFGASTGGGAALVTAVARPDLVRAVVSRGGRPDLAGPALPSVRAPTLLIVGGLDTPVIQVNREAMQRMPGTVALEIVPGATHLFEGPGALDHVSRLAGDWFERHL